jgi:CBS domain-containing protein
LVIDDNYRLVGIVTLHDIQRAVSHWEKKSSHLEQELLATSNNQTLGDICTRDLLYAYEDEPTSEALTRMAARGLRQLPVVDRNDHSHVLGLLEQEKISLACSLAMTQQFLRPYTEKPTLTEPVSLPISKQPAA